jgi:high affinity Mn2+ porin
MRWLLLICLALAAPAQQLEDEIHAQATTITQTHPPFHSPYTGSNSLRPVWEADTSLTATFFLTLRYRGTELDVNPELAGGQGFSNVTGIAGFTNGEIPRVGSPTPTPYLARLYVAQKYRCFRWIGGKFAATDFFDQNAYSHDPRTQFMNWSIIYNGAWDYPADVRGYTIGVVQELTAGPVVFRVGSFLEPVAANGPDLDYHFAASRGDTFELQYAYSKGGTVRALAFVNHANMGTYRLAAQDIIATRRPDTVKYGFGLNVEQRISSDAGVFLRLGWNDGKTESWAFTEIDRTVSGGVSLQGNRWRRQDDTLGVAVAVNGISGDHASYLARGGYGFIIGDGRLPHYAPETVFETYYRVRIRKPFSVSPDYQFIVNPAYNQDRGPVHVFSIRLHFEI